MRGQYRPLSPKLQRPYVLRQTRQDGRPQRASVAQLCLQNSCSVCSIHHDLGNPGTLERQNLPHSQRHAANGCERFGIELSKRPQPSTFTSAEKHRAHFFAQSEGVARALAHTVEFVNEMAQRRKLNIPACRLTHILNKNAGYLPSTWAFRLDS